MLQKRALRFISTFVNWTRIWINVPLKTNHLVLTTNCTRWLWTNFFPFRPNLSLFCVPNLRHAEEMWRWDTRKCRHSIVIHHFVVTGIPVESFKSSFEMRCTLCTLYTNQWNNYNSIRKSNTCYWFCSLFFYVYVCVCVRYFQEPNAYRNTCDV